MTDIEKVTFSKQQKSAKKLFMYLGFIPEKQLYNNLESAV